MSKFYPQIVDLIKQSAPGNAPEGHGVKYLGTTHVYYCLGTLPKRQIAKDWQKAHSAINYKEYVSLLDALYKGESYEEKTIASEILNLYPTHRQQLELQKIYEWLEHLEGWAEIDTLCQGSFPAIEVLKRWNEWEDLLEKLNKDADIKRRRASLVLLCKSARETADPRVSKLALNNISNVMEEKDILITKAVSWLLRSLIKHHRKEVEEFISQNEDRLPKIALRETRKKLSTGRK